MSRWTESNRKIDVPVHQENVYICVEHPGLVKNVDNALKTLGGLENVAKIYSKPAQRMPVYWRPDDVYCKATYGDRAATTSLLMKVRRRTRKRDGKVEYSVAIQGRVEVMYRFQAMCDFQYLPMKTNADGSHESIYENVVIDRLMQRHEYMSQDAPLFLPPLTFSRVDRPCDFLYRQDIEHRGPYKNPDVNRPVNLIGTVRQRRSIYTIFVNFGEPLPAGPVDDAVKKLSAEFVDPEGEGIIKKLLEEKPLWLKVEMEQRTGYRGEKLKIFLPAMCFYWLDGPWRAQWNKFGFNPTKDPSAKIYQSIDFRIRQVKPGQMKVKAKRSDTKMIRWNQLNRNQKHNVKININALSQEEQQASDKRVKEEKELVFKFLPDRLPPQRMMYYPVNYVYIEEVQKLLHSNDGKETVCTEKDGWCIKDFNLMCRDLMYTYVNRLLVCDDSAEMKFWRSKKKKRNVAQFSDDDSEQSDTELGGGPTRPAGTGPGATEPGESQTSTAGSDLGNMESTDGQTEAVQDWQADEVEAVRVEDLQEAGTAGGDGEAVREESLQEARTAGSDGEAVREESLQEVGTAGGDGADGITSAMDVDDDPDDQQMEND